MTTAKSVNPADGNLIEPRDAAEPPASIDASIQGALGRKLRESYDEVVKERVPDKFLQLLDQLKETERSRNPGET